MPYRLIVLAFVALLSLVPLGSVAAQDDIPSPQEQRQTLEDGGLPEATDLGPGWSAGNAYSYEATEDFPFESHVITYGDRYGSRIQIVALLFDRGDDNAAFEVVANRVIDNSQTLYPGTNAPTSRDLRNLADPRDCESVERAVGEDPINYFFVGSIACLDGSNDRALYVSVSGLYDSERYQDAAEAVLGIVLDIEPGGGVAGSK